MPRRLPPLNALPSFEAAARHLSFSRAADELHVTHGAVSRAVRNLEDQLGVQLMIRATRSARLTAPWVTCNSSAALEKLRWRAAASKLGSAFKGGRRRGMTGGSTCEEQSQIADDYSLVISTLASHDETRRIPRIPSAMELPDMRR